MIMHRRFAFSLIELMVVIVIILVLAALLFPLFARAREKARQSTCISNQRQITQALLMTVQDEKENFPPASSWVKDTMAYLGSDKVMNCPSTTRTGSATVSDYGMNQYLCEMPFGAMKDSSNIVMTADANNELLAARDDADVNRHQHGFVVSFVDGHQKFMPAAGCPIIFGEGDEGTVLSFGAINVPVTFTGAAAAKGESTTVEEGSVVLLTNDSTAPITAQVTVSGGDTAPAQGLNPATADLKIAPGKSKAFALNCRTTTTGGKVDTAYTFGVEPNAVTLTALEPRPEEE